MTTEHADLVALPPCPSWCVMTDGHNLDEINPGVIHSGHDHPVEGTNIAGGQQQPKSTLFFSMSDIHSGGHFVRSPVRIGIGIGDDMLWVSAGQARDLAALLTHVAEVADEIQPDETAAAAAMGIEVRETPPLPIGRDIPIDHDSSGAWQWAEALDLLDDDLLGELELTTDQAEARTILESVGLLAAFRAAKQKAHQLAGGGQQSAGPAPVSPDSPAEEAGPL